MYKGTIVVLEGLKVRTAPNGSIIRTLGVGTDITADELRVVSGWEWLRLTSVNTNPITDDREWWCCAGSEYETYIEYVEVGVEPEPEPEPEPDVEAPPEYFEMKWIDGLVYRYSLEQ